jgi:hypothetical protein
VRLLVVVPADVGAEVAEPGLAGRAAAVGAQVGDGVVHVDGSVDGGGVGEDVGGVAQLQLFAEAGGDFVGIDWGVPGWQVDDRFQMDGAVLAEQQAEPAEQDWADVFDAGHTGACGEGFGAEVYIDHGAGPGPLRARTAAAGSAATDGCCGFRSTGPV